MAVKSINSLLGNVDKNMNYGYGTPGNPIPALNNRNPLQGNAPGSPNSYDNAVNSLVNAVKPREVYSPTSVMPRSPGPARNGLVSSELASTYAPAAPTQNFPSTADNTEIQALKDYFSRPKAGFSETQFANAPLKTQTFPTPNDDAEIQALRDYLNSPSLDPSMPGRFAETKRPGYGVPDLPTFGQTVEKTPGPRVNIPSTPFDMRTNEAMTNAILGETTPKAYGADPYGTTNMVANPQTTMPNSYPNIGGIPKQYVDRVKEQARLSTIPGPEARQLNSYGVSTADALQNGLTEQASVLSGNPAARPAMTLGNLTGSPPDRYPSPNYGSGPAQDVDETASIDPTSNYPPEVQVTANKIMNVIGAIAKRTPLGMKGYDYLFGNTAYRDDVSIGTSESGRRTDRAPSVSQGGYSAPGTGNKNGGGSPSGAGVINTGVSGVPGWTHPTASSGGSGGSGGGGSGGGGTQPFTPSPINPVPVVQPWYYPQYTQTWANLPTGLGGF